MLRYSVHQSRIAEIELTQIVHCISIELCAPQSAVKIAQIIRKAINSLKVLPYRYNLVDNEHLSAMGFRRMPVKNYNIFYTIDDETKTVYIESIMYAGRDWPNILGERG